MKMRKMMKKMRLKKKMEMRKKTKMMMAINGDQKDEVEQGRIHGSISRVRVGRGSIVVGQGQ